MKTSKRKSAGRQLPRPYRQFKKDFPEAAEAYERLGNACRQGPLDARTRELVKLGIAMGAGLESGTHSHARRALDAGATPDEVRHAALLATTTLGFPAMMRAMSWVNDVLKK